LTLLLSGSSGFQLSTPEKLVASLRGRLFSFFLDLCCQPSTRVVCVNITVNNFIVVIRSWLVPKPQTFGSAARLDYSAVALLLYIYESRGEFSHLH